MATRFFLPNPGFDNAPVTVALDAGWEKFNQVLRLWTKTRPQNTATVGRTFTGNGAAGDVLAAQYVSDPIEEQTISGTVKGMVRVNEQVATDDYFAAMVAKIVSRDGGTVRGTLISAFGGGNEFGTVSGALKFPPGWAGAGTSVTSIDAVEGDRIVLEIGYNQTSTSVSSGVFRFGDDAAGVDVSETEGDNVGRSWIEFSADIIFPSSVLPAPGHFGPF